MQLKINLATRSYLNFFQINLAIFATIFLLSAGAIFFAWRIAVMSGEINRVTDELTVLQGKSHTGVNEQDYRKVLDKIRFANGIIAKKSYDWLALLDKLETVVPEGVAVTSLNPDTRTGTISISGMATNFSGVRTFMENLEASTSFTEIYLQSQSDTKVGQNQQGVAFQITCKVTFT